MFHKVLVIVGLNWISFSNGFLYGQVAGIISSLQKNDEGLNFSEGQISLIASTMTIVNLIGVALVAAITDKVGRRWPFIVFSTTAVINWIILLQAKEMYQFMLSRIIGGISAGALWILTIFVTSEYTSPKTRAFYLNMVTTVAPAIGTAFAHAIGIVVHWRTVALIGTFPAAVGIVLPYFWVESPHWLASTGKFEECQAAFRKLHGRTIHSEKELQLLIKVEMNKLDLSQSNCKSTALKLFRAFKRRYFWDLFILSVFIHAYLAAAGKFVFSTLATVILEEITETSDVLLFTLLVDGFIVLGSCMSCLLIRKTSVRTLLFSTGFIANAILVVFSICFYFKNGQAYSNWINVLLLALYFIILNSGPYPLLEAIYSEMFPIEFKVYVFFLSGSILVAALSLSIMLLPYTVSAIGYHGLFVLNAAIMSLSLGYLWFKLPETKGKTLQEIEMYFKTKKFDDDLVSSIEQSKVLI